jgi:CRP/FNR family transcriptional regulator
MSSRNGQQAVEGPDGNQQIPCASLIIEDGGLDKSKVTKSYPRGFVLFNEGQRPLGVYVLREGRAKVSVASVDGKTLVLRIAEAGDLLGVNSVMMGKPAGATVQTLGPCRIDFIPGDAFLESLERNEKAYLSVARALSEKLNGVMDHARLLLLSNTAAQKLAKLLIRWCDEQGQGSPDGVRIDYGFTHAELAQLICTSRETVTRLLGDFQRMQIVSVIPNGIIVRNRRALEAATGL